MSDFLTLEESAEQLGVSDAQLRSWIKRGLARATRRGGEYALRPSEVDRLRDDPPEGQGDASSEPTTAPQRPKVLPPRSEKNPDSFAGERDRRRRMGRRASDFTLEILHQEIKTAVAAALEPILPRLEPLRMAEPQPQEASHHYEIEALESRILELESQLRHQEAAREEYRQRLEESERRRQQAESNPASSADQQRISQLESQIEHEIRARQEFQHRLEDSERKRHEAEQLGRQAQHSEDGALRLARELSLEREKRLETEQNLERVSAELEALQSDSLAMDAERARFSLEARSLQAEIDRLTIMQESWESQKREWEQAQQVRGDAERALEEKNSELRHLREQVTSLTYRLQMAGSGATGTSPEESRRLMERLAEAQAEMAEKNQLVNQTYAEIGELRSRLEDTQRNFYELQQRHERLKEEWGQLVAQMAARQMSEHQQQQAPPPPGPGERPKGWGSLFGRRD
ncbi:helix-turn-helix domain-containing protein [bacterium]|nr:helix-turn-helix domain-containing protein [bacterium]